MSRRQNDHEPEHAAVGAIAYNKGERGHDNVVLPQASAVRSVAMHYRRDCLGVAAGQGDEGFPDGGGDLKCVGD